MAKNSGGADDSGAPYQLPVDLTGLSDEDLAAQRDQASAEFDAIYEADGGPQADDFARAEELATAIEKLGAETDRRAAVAAETADKFANLRNRVKPPTEPDEPVDGDADPAEPPAAVPAQPEPVAASGRPKSSTQAIPRDFGGVSGPSRRLNASLSRARKGAPATTAPGRAELAITAAAELPGKLGQGQRVQDLNQLADIVHHRARNLAVVAAGRGNVSDGAYGGVTVARIANQFDKVVDDRTDPGEIADMVREMTKPEILTAGGGWCAPSDTRYDFFNIVGMDGAVDLPTLGITRGGLRFPVSPSLADTFSPAVAPFGAAFSNATVPWLWTETDDILTVTGSTNKPCIRVPCSSMSDARLECYGICLTAGNLADDAWPESTRNFLKLLMAAHFHASNGRYLAQMSTLSTNIGTINCVTGVGALAPILGTVDLAATDYRSKFGMGVDDIIEVVLPDWAESVIRSDIARRTGVSDLFAVSDEMMASWFDTRDVRVQLVNDWQIRGANQPGASGGVTTWPTSVDLMVFAPGTFVRGNGMSLDLGVVRDSTLNAENDHTAAWMEECHLIARIGHESRKYTVPICPNGTTGSANITACCA